jgi:hypothetical protein
MNANAEVLRGSTVIGASVRDAASPTVVAVRLASQWNPENFAREQIRGLVRRVFFANGDRAAKQVVFSAADPDLDVSSMCGQVACALAGETRTQVALVESGHEVERPQLPSTRDLPREVASIRSLATQMAINLWRVQRSEFGDRSGQSGTAMHLRPCLAELRNEFEYAVIEGPSAGLSSEAALLGQLTDGIILVLGSRKTRQATALKIKEMLEAAGCRILGTVLMERTFPIPARIYHHL